MAIEGLSNTTMAYQGSAPVVEARAVEVARQDRKVVSDVETKNEVEHKDEAKSVGSLSEKNSVSEQMNGQSQIKKAIEEINKAAKQSEAIFGIHEGTNRVTIKIVDKETRKVLKEFPPEKTLDMIEKAWELAGLMVDEKR